MKKLLPIVLCILAAGVVWHASLLSVTDPDGANLSQLIVQAPEAAPARTLTIGWTGDMVPSSDISYNLTVLNAVSDRLAMPDLMIGNLEGTFAHAGRASKCAYIASMCHAFQGDPSFADTLKAAGFDFVSLINNHSLDYGAQGLQDTEAELDRVGLPYIAPDRPTASIVVNGTHIGIMGLSSTQPTATITDYAYVAQTVRSLKKDNDMVVVIFHGGAEGSDQTAVTGGEEYQGSEDRGNVQAVAYTAINAGADLVLGDGPHVLRKVQVYQQKPIAYSLGNFVGGKGRLMTPAGTLSLGGIFTATFENNTPKTTAFSSVLLAKDGTPSLDPANRAQQLLDSLSK